jgi:hypothetical protein
MLAAFRVVLLVPFNFNIGTIGQEFGVLGGVIFKLDILKTGRLLFFGSVLHLPHIKNIYYLDFK